MLAAFVAFATMAMLFAGPVSAQATRTWVSGVGDDANPCSRTAPCKTFAGAISKTAASGEIDCLDPGGFGALTITKALTIDCQGLSNGGVLVSGTNGILVNVTTGDTHVQLIGLDINGLNTGLSGVSVIGPDDVAIINCLIYGFQAGGSGNGVFVSGNTGAHVMIENSIIRQNTNGVTVTTPSGQADGVIIEHSVLDSNIATNLNITAAGGGVVLSASSLVASPTAIANTGGTVISYGNNLIRGAGAPTSTSPLQ
jgi:hypothetical protein